MGLYKKASQYREPKRKPVSERKKLVKKLDKICREILLIRDRVYGDYFICITCHKTLPIEEAQVCHYISRRHESLRWDLRNIWLGCAHCNKWLGGNLIEYRKSLIQKIGEKEVEKMETFYRETPHYTAFDLSLLAQEREKMLAGLKGQL